MAGGSAAFDRWHHDLKNQLGIILGFSELLLHEMDAADTRRADIQEIHTAALRAMASLQNIPLMPLPKEDGAR